MPTLRKGHQERMDMVRMLVKFHLTNPEIARTLGVSRDTINLDRRLLNIEEAKHHIRERTRVNYLISAFTRVHEGNIKESENALCVLKRGLETALCVPEILAGLKGVEIAICGLPPTNTQAIRYRRLLGEIFRINLDSAALYDYNEFLHQCFVEILQNPFLEINSLETLHNYVLTTYLMRKSDQILPFWSEEVAQMAIKEIDKMLTTIDPREGEILRQRFGLKRDPQILKEVGKFFGLSRERIRTIESQALRKLRHSSRSSHLKQFVLSSTELLKERLEKTT